MDTLPDWLTPLPDAERMRAIDRWAIERRGVPSLELMERAGAGVARAVERLVPDGPVTVVCGTGNNGGDGLVVARLLREAGRPVTVLSAGPLAKLGGDARTNLQRLPDAPPLELAHGGEAALVEEALAGASVVVDALLGTGFTGAPRGAVAEAIAAIRACAAPVVSVDVPSGVDASTGVVAGAAACTEAGAATHTEADAATHTEADATTHTEAGTVAHTEAGTVAHGEAGVVAHTKAAPAAAVRATVTVTFHMAKPGLWIHPGKAHAGAVEVLDIGIPRGAPATADIGLIAPAVLRLLPRRGPGSTKFTSGHVLVAGGSRGLTGAPRMAALGAMRAGAGYLTACVPASLQAIVAGGGTPELMTRGLPEESGGLAPAGVEVVLEAARRAGALALGPGLGRSEHAIAFARALARRAEVPLVLDADGLNAHSGASGAHAGSIDDLAARTAATVLTPHPGELARLLDTDTAAIMRERLAYTRAAAARARAVVVLKGDDTLIADPSGLLAVSPGASPALATAGTGDVLSGVIAALISQGLPAFTAAAAGVLLHAEAGRLAAGAVGAPEGVIASDVIAALPAARGAGA